MRKFKQSHRSRSQLYNSIVTMALRNDDVIDLSRGGIRRHILKITPRHVAELMLELHSVTRPGSRSPADHNVMRRIDRESRDSKIRIRLHIRSPRRRAREVIDRPCPVRPAALADIVRLRSE